MVASHGLVYSLVIITSLSVFVLQTVKGTSQSTTTIIFSSNHYFCNVTENSNELYCHVSALECFSCVSQEDNNEKCISTVQFCDPEIHDACSTNIRWGGNQFQELRLQIN